MPAECLREGLKKKKLVEFSTKRLTPPLSGKKIKKSFLKNGFNFGWWVTMLEIVGDHFFSDNLWESG